MKKIENDKGFFKADAVIVWANQKTQKKQEVVAAEFDFEGVPNEVLLP